VFSWAFPSGLENGAGFDKGLDAIPAILPADARVFESTPGRLQIVRHAVDRDPTGSQLRAHCCNSLCEWPYTYDRLIERDHTRGKLVSRIPHSRIYWAMSRVIFDKSAADWMILLPSSNRAMDKGARTTGNSAVAADIRALKRCTCMGIGTD
jgi:hypothetical protein